MPHHHILHVQQETMMPICTSQVRSSNEVMEEARNAMRIYVSTILVEEPVMVGRSTSFGEEALGIPCAI